jgi:hypothetical protein
MLPTKRLFADQEHHPPRRDHTDRAADRDS